MSLGRRPPGALRIASAGAFLLLSSAAFPAASQTEVPLSVSGNEATGSFQVGGFGADLAIRFEQSTGLDPAALRVLASVVDPLDASLLARLPSGVGIPVGFPVLVAINPTAASALTFNGVATISLHTHDLDYSPDSVLALYSAHGPGSFIDITASAGAGSYRVSGSSGTFSDFLIVLDPRSLDAVIAEKYDRLQQTLDDHAGAMPSALVADLRAQLAASRSHHEGGRTAEAISTLDGFSAAVLAHSGATIPDQWRAGGGAVNVAGLLRARADTLRFSLDRKATRGH